MKKILLCLFMAGSLPALAQYDTISVGYLGVGTYVNKTFNLNVGGKSRFANPAHFGESFDDTPYGYGIQVARPANQGDTRFHLSFVRAGQWVAGMGFLQSSNTFAIQNYGNNSVSTGIFITSASNVGINNRTPATALDVNGTVRAETGMVVNMASLPTGYTLAVNGTIGGTKLKVTQSWADYVFAAGYKLPSLAEVEAHIKENHKLPDIPSEKQIAAEGLDVGEMQKLQMQKIEELTLYIIDLKKQLEAQQKEIEALKAK
ncbi:MAG: hypothetical protein H6Q26_1776 [Bacteroidetes bacterium]|uniref:hypothetical protein n=1 Tax=[Flexibacter] sp. ATCC 35208 TaxID=1936242 RepID=UPI00117E2297|nr:hypothetical protein [[Flexibacter] sp. ATCC 35208]MBP1651619.1 hypothetical protein [Bacteroidota bacterium]